MIRLTLTTTGIAAATTILLGGAFVAGRATTPDTTAPASITPAAQPEQMGMPTPEQVKEMMAASAAKAPEHDVLARFAGAWNAEMNFLTAPGADPEVSHAKAEYTAILDGRFVKNHYKGMFKFMGAEMPFEGYGMLGYDTARGEYVTAWCDNLSTSMLVEKGEPGDDADRITVEGQMLNQMGAESPFRHVYAFHDDGSFTLEFHQPDPATGEMMKIGWIDHSRP